MERNQNEERIHYLLMKIDESQDSRSGNSQEAISMKLELKSLLDADEDPLAMDNLARHNSPVGYAEYDVC